MSPYPWTHVGTPSHLGHMDRVAATMPSQAHAGAAQDAPDIGQWEGQDVPLVRPSSCNAKGGIPSSRRYLRTYLQVPGKAKAESDECPKIQALRARLKQKYGDTFFSGKPVFPPPVRGPYGEAKIRMKPDPRV